MKKLISIKLAGSIFITINVLMIIMHILIMLKILPSDFVWGGQINDDASLMRLELIALIVSFVFLAIAIIKMNSLKAEKSQKVINVVVWFMFFYFLLNIVGNLASDSTLEKIIFLPITVILTVTTFRLAIEK